MVAVWTSPVVSLPTVPRPSYRVWWFPSVVRILVGAPTLDHTPVRFRVGDDFSPRVE